MRVGPGAPGSGAGRAASRMPTPARAIPANCTALGRSPCTSPASTGTTPDRDAVGATIPIGPIESPWYSAASPMVPASPAPTPASSAVPLGAGSPVTRTRRVMSTNPANWPTTMTFTTGNRRVIRPPTKSAAPQVRPERRPSARGNIAGG